jgi:hypothetical protein
MLVVHSYWQGVLTDALLLLLLLPPAGEEGLTVTVCEDWSDNIRWALMHACSQLVDASVAYQGGLQLVVMQACNPCLRH